MVVHRFDCCRPLLRSTGSNGGQYVYHVLCKLYSFFDYANTNAYKISRKANDVQIENKMLSNGLQYGLPLLAFAVTSWQAATVQLVFVAGSLILSLQNLTLMNPAVRRMLGIYPRFKSGPNSLDTYRSTLTSTAGIATRTTKPVLSAAEKVRENARKEYEAKKSRQKAKGVLKTRTLAQNEAKDTNF
jgi:hypothetical protein